MLDAYPVGQLFVVSGRVFKPSDSPAMYLYGSDGYLWALGSQNELNAGLTWVNNVIVAPFSALQYNGIKIYTAIVKNKGEYYAAQSNGSLRKLPISILSSQKDLYAMPFDDPIINKTTVDSASVGFIRFDNGTIFKIDSASGKIRPINSYNTYIALGGISANTTQVSVKANNAFTVGDPL